MRAGVPPKDLPALSQGLLRSMPPLGTISSIADLANGLFYIRGYEDGLDMLRKRAKTLGGYAVALAMPHGWTMDRWGYMPESLYLMQAIKERWDPQGLINLGAFLV
jgi:D-lactate dehydrogenase (cytochrome)